jgi:hypothetical protein
LGQKRHSAKLLPCERVACRTECRPLVHVAVVCLPFTLDKADGKGSRVQPRKPTLLLCAGTIRGVLSSLARARRRPYVGVPALGLYAFMGMLRFYGYWSARPKGQMGNTPPLRQ